MDIDRETWIFLAVLVPSVIVHEVSHGWVALLFGDDTAKQAGRLTLNPIAHVDVFGTLILPFMLIVTGAPAFGYAKPVPVNPGRMRDPRNGSLVTSLAGPAVNIGFALLGALWVRQVGLQPYGELWPDVAFAFGIINVYLAVFTLLPVPPLDGSAVIERLLPQRWWPQYLKLRQYSMMLLLLLVFWGGDVLDRVFDPAVRLWGELL